MFSGAAPDIIITPKQLVILKTVLGALRYDGDTDSISRDREVVIFINISPIIYWAQPLSAPPATGVGGGGEGGPSSPHSLIQAALLLFLI